MTKILISEINIKNLGGFELPMETVMSCVWEVR